MRRRNTRCLSLLLGLLMLLLCGCGAVVPRQAEATEAVSAEEAAEEAEILPVPEPETPQPLAEAVSPSDGLPPEPPEGGWIGTLPYVDITSWQFRLANSYNSIANYAPPYGGFEGQGFDARATEAIRDFIYAARDAGYTVYASVELRNFEYLFYHYLSDLNNVTHDAVKSCSHMLPPGANEHQTGLAFDISTHREYGMDYSEYSEPEAFDTEVFQWMKEHCAEYGFILRYPEGKEEWYGLACDHPHFRYVGTEAARFIMDNGLCLEEFLRLYDPNAAFVPANKAF